AEDARERHEQQRAQLEARVVELEGEIEPLRADQQRSSDTSLRWQTELERLRADQSHFGDDLRQENARLAGLAADLEMRVQGLTEQLEKERAEARDRIDELQQANAAFGEQAQEAIADQEALAMLQQQHAALSDSHAALETRATQFALEAVQLKPRAAELESQVERLRARTLEHEAE